MLVTGVVCPSWTRPVSRRKLAISYTNSPAAENQPKIVAEPDISQILCCLSCPKIKLKFGGAKFFVTLISGSLVMGAVILH